MVNIRGIHDHPTVSKSIKTTIKNGVIVRTPVWKDTMGNEMMKTSKGFTRKQPPFQQFVWDPNLQKSFIIQSDVDFWGDVLCIFCLFMTILMIFTLGYLVGSLKVRRTYNQKATEIKTQ